MADQLQEQREMVRDRSRRQRETAAEQIERRAQAFNARLAERRAERHDDDQF